MARKGLGRVLFWNVARGKRIVSLRQLRANRRISSVLLCVTS